MKGCLSINVRDVALIFEGGGMRAAHTAAVLNTLLKNNVYFADVYGISAGSTNVVNYISRDSQRARRSFVEFIGEKHVAGLGQMLLGNGYFNSRLIYQKSGEPDGLLPFDYDTFMANPAQMHIESYEVDSGRTVEWTKADIGNLKDLMTMVQASSSMPVVMPVVSFRGHRYLDGGLGDSWGIMLDAAIRDGYERFFVVCTQPQGFRKSPSKRPWLNKLLMGKHPDVLYRSEQRYRFYNEIYDRLDTLASEGRALVYHPQIMELKNTTIDRAKLATAYEQGLAQSEREFDSWRDFLDV
jgi:predicted patatin/cPLA2 family phospholipase